MDSFSRFVAKLYERIRGKIKDADLTAAEFDEAVKAARGHVGGTIRWENAKAGDGSQMNDWRLLSELALAEDKKTARVQIFPKVQKYDHPRYGELDVSKAFLNEIKANFDAQIYGQDLPLTIDLEHETKLSGPAGWFQDLEIDGEKGMFATIAFNDRGQTLVADGDGYKYFSPEFYDEWTDPATGKKYSNVLIGGALCSRPFFKGMAPVAMMREDSLLFVELAEKGNDSMDMMGMMQEMMAKMKAMMSKGQMPDEEMMAEMSGMMAKMKKSVNPQGEKKASDPPEDSKLADPNGGKNMGMTEEEARQFAETQNQLKSLSERVQAAEAKAASEAEARMLAEEKAKTALESVASLERSAQRKQFSEHVKANRLAYQGEVEEAVDRLERLSKSMSTEDFTAYVAERELWHKQMSESKLFTQIGHNQPVANGVEAEMQTVTRKIMADNPGMSEVEASVKAAEQNPALYKRYDEAHKAKARRGGE